jgi:very-short-patch-repair endonuclease
MWRLLKANFPEARFRRQVPLRHYLADFASHSSKLVIEIDGGQHDRDRDAARTTAIEAEGYRVVRFWNNEVMENGDGCMTRLAQFLRHDHPHPATTRQSFDKLRIAKSAHPSPIEGEEK